MDKDQAKRQICGAMQPFMDMSGITFALLMNDVEKLDSYRKEMVRLSDKAKMYCDEIDKCEKDEEMHAVLGKVTRE